MTLLQTLKSWLGGSTPSTDKPSAKPKEERRSSSSGSSRRKPRKPKPDASSQERSSDEQRKPRQHRGRRDGQSHDHRKKRGPHHRHDQRRDQRRSQSKPVAEKPVVKPKGKVFSELGLSQQLLDKLTEQGFTHATEVQERSIPANLEGKNIFCSSETGSGKTLSFLLPMVQKLHKKEIYQGLVICPTREIAIQIHKTLVSISDDSITSALVIGGTNMEQQKKALLEHPQILVATPGRLIDMLNTGLIWLQYTGYVVLDEADRMLDMGFEEELMEIHSQLSGDQQTVLFSATLFPEIKKMAKRYADTYEEIVIGNPTSVASTVRHVLVEMRDDEKLSALKYLIARNPGKMMVFFNTIRDTIAITRKVSNRYNPNIDCIHSKISQADRERIIEEFRGTETDVLLASDVASRGIDVPNVELVINYDIPNNSEEYIHRVGRTGRAGQSGMAISFYSQKHKQKLKAIEKLIEGKIERRRSIRGLV